MNKLLLLFIPIALVVIVPTPCLGNANYKNICLNSSNYNGSATVTVHGGATGTCDAKIATSSFQGKNFATLSCINDFDNGDTMNSNGIASELIRYFEPDCCTDKKSICWKDFSKLCKTPSNYNGDGMLGNYRCDFYLTTQSGIDWSDPSSAASADKQAFIVQWGKSCCSDGKSVFHDDYSKICKNPSTYIGTNIVTSMGTSNCDEVMFLNMKSETQYTFRNKPFATLKCSDLKDSLYSLEKSVAPTCCSDKKSICDRDYSKLCKDPSTYNKDGKFSKDVTGDEDNVCGGYNFAKIMAVMKKNDLNISNVDSNTCADYDFLNGDGTTMNLLTYMEDMSTCCGANGGGVAKNGCKAALDTTAFGPKSISIGAISFILPMIVMSYFHCAI